MGRLENIIARNRGPGRLQERVIASMVMGAIVLLIIVLAVFTDWGLPPEAGDAPTGSDASEASGASQGSGTPDGRDLPSGRDGREAPPAPATAGGRKRVDGVLLRTQPVRPAARPPQRE